MAANNNISTLNGLFKEVYASKLEHIIPDGVKLLKSIPFVAKDQQNGSHYNQPVVLGMEHGVSFATSGDAFTLNPAIAGVIQNAQVLGAQLVMRSVLSYTAASRALAGGATAFESSTKFLVSNMMRSMARKLEIELLYGQMGYGTVASGAGTTTMVITTAEWAPGIWVGAESMPIEIRDPAGVVLQAGLTVVSVDMEARSVTVDATLLVGVVAGSVVHHTGAYGNEFAGLQKIITNTGNLFGISAATYALWKGNTYAAGGALSFAKINSAIAKAVEKGLDSNVKVLVNPRSWSNLLTDQAALRTFDSSYSSEKSEMGAKSIKFYGQNGEIEIEPSIFVKEGLAFILPMDELVRIGSSDITFKRPGQGDEFFRDLETSAGYELRAYCDQAVFCAAPGKMALITGIVNS